MANYYTDIPELKYHLNNPMMKRICELKERNYRDKDEFDYAYCPFWVTASCQSVDSPRLSKRSSSDVHL